MWTIILCCTVDHHMYCYCLLRQEQSETCTVKPWCSTILCKIFCLWRVFYSSCHRWTSLAVRPPQHPHPPQRPRLVQPFLHRLRTKFDNYTAVTLGLEGEEGSKASARIWNAVDNRLKSEVGPGVDCLLTRVKSR